MSAPGFQTLAELAEWYGSVADLPNPDSVDWDNPAAVLREVFTASDCGDFAYALSRMTGWTECVLLSDGPAHAFVRSPDGRFLDASGWVTLPALAKRYGSRKFVVSESSPNVLACLSGEVDDEGVDQGMARVVSAVRALPWAPFDQKWFRALTLRPLPGVDAPSP